MGVATKVAGATLLVLGILLLLGGAAAAAIAFSDERENQEQFIRDDDRSDRNVAGLVGGTVAAALGTLLLLVGIVVLVASASQTARLAHTSAIPGAAPPSLAPSRAPKPAGSGLPVLVSAVVGLLLLALVVGALVLTGTAPLATTTADTQGDSWPMDRFAGTLSGTRNPILGSVADGSGNGHDFQRPDGAATMTALVLWNVTSTGAEHLLVVVSAEGREVGRWTGPPGFTFSFAPEPALKTMRYTVYPGDNPSAVQGQPFVIETRFA